MACLMQQRCARYFRSMMVSTHTYKARGPAPTSFQHCQGSRRCTAWHLMPHHQSLTECASQQQACSDLHQLGAQLPAGAQQAQVVPGMAGSISQTCGYVCVCVCETVGVGGKEGHKLKLTMGEGRQHTGFVRRNVLSCCKQAVACLSVDMAGFAKTSAGIRPPPRPPDKKHRHAYLPGLCHCQA